MTKSSGADVPPGFQPTPMGGPYCAAAGPFYVREAEGTVRLGLRIDERHVNSIGHCHGGLVSTVLDMAMPAAMNRDPRIAALACYLPTVSLQVDFLAPVFFGEWLEASTEILRITRTLVFAQGLARADGELVARCSGVYKIGPPIPAGSVGMYTDVSPRPHPRRR